MIRLFSIENFVQVNNAAVPGLDIVSPEKFINGGGFVSVYNSWLLRSIFTVFITSWIAYETVIMKGLTQ